MGANLGNIVVKVGADISNYESQLSRANALAEKFGATQLLETAKAASGYIAVAAGAYQAGKALVSFAQSAGHAAEHLSIVSKQTGLATQSLQGYEPLLNRSNVEVGDLALTFRYLSHQIQEAATPTSQAAKNFAQLGISLDGDRSPEAMLEKLADSLAQLPDGFAKTNLATEVGGRSMLALIPVLNEGGAAFRKSKEDAERLGTALSEAAINKAAKFDDAMDDLKLATDGFGRQVGALVAGPMTAFVDRTTAMIGGVNNLVKAMQDGGVAATLGGLLNTQALPHARPSTRTVVMPDASTQEAMADAAGIMDPRMLGRNTESLGTLTQKLRTMSEEYKGLAIVAHTTMFTIANNQAKANAEVAMGSFLARKGIDDYKAQAAAAHDMAVQDAAAMEAEINRQSAVDRGLAGYQFVAKYRNEQVYATKALMELIPELTGQEAHLLAVENQRQADNIIAQERTRHQVEQSRISTLQTTLDLERANFAIQQEFYASAPGAIGQAEAARTAAFRVFEAEERQRMALLEESTKTGELTTQQFHDRVLLLDLDLQQKRMATARQFPTFWEQQLNSLTQSNAFSMGQITHQFTGSFARFVVEGQKFKQFWVGLQESVLQYGANTAIQWAAEWAKAELQRMTATEIANSSIAASSSAVMSATMSSIMAVVQAMKALMLGVARAAVSVVGTMIGALTPVLTGVAVAVGTIMETVGAAVIQMGTSMASIPIIGWALAGGMIALGSATMAAGAALPGVIGGVMGGLAAGVASIGASIPAMADGGIVTSPMLAMIGEGGESEAVIPLSRLSQMTGEKTHTIIIELDGRVLSRSVVRNMPDMLRLSGVRA